MYHLKRTEQRTASPLDEEKPQLSSDCNTRPQLGSLPQLSKTVVQSGVMTHAIKGCFTTPGKVELLLARDTFIQLANGDVTRMENIQPVFAPIIDIQAFRWRSSLKLQSVAEADRGKDLVLLLSGLGTIAVLIYSARLKRFVDVPGSRQTPSLNRLENYDDSLTMMSLYTTSPYIVAASSLQVLIFQLHCMNRDPHSTLPLGLSNDRVLAFKPASGSIVAAVCQLPREVGDQESHALVAVLTHPLGQNAQPAILVLACPFSEDGLPSKEGLVQLSRFEAVHGLGGWPLKLIAFPPSEHFRVRGIVIAREHGMTVLSMPQLLGTEEADVALQTSIETSGVFAAVYISHAWLEEVERPNKLFLLVALSREGGAALVFCSFWDRLQKAANWCHRSAWELSPWNICHAAICMLALPNHSLLLSLENGCTLELSPLDSQNNSLAEAMQHSMSPPIEALLSSSNCVSWDGLLLKRVDIACSPIKDFVVVEHKGMPEVVGACAKSPAGSLCFIQAGQQAPVELEGPTEASAVTGIWSLKQRPSDACHSLMLVSFADASRAVSAGRMLRDMSEAVGICENERTIACGELAESIIVQVTPSHVACCGLQALEHEFGSEGEPASHPKRRSSLTAWFNDMAMPDTDTEADQLLTRAERHMAASTAASPETNTHSWTTSAIDREESSGKVWMPPGGATISSAACAPGLVVAFHGAGREGRLVALRYQNVTSPAKRKRDNHEGWGLVWSGMTALDAEPSAIDIKRCRKGGHIVAVCMHGPQIDLFHIHHEQGSMTSSFAKICQLSSSALNACVASAGFAVGTILGPVPEPAESIHLLPGLSISNQEQEPEERVVAFHLLASWRSGYLLHLKLIAAATPPCSQEYVSQDPVASGCSPEDLVIPFLASVTNMGLVPAAVRQLPGKVPSFLAVGTRAAIVQYNPAKAELDVCRLGLPGVRLAAPMYIPGSRGRCKKMLLCANDANRLQLRKLPDQPLGADQARIKTRPMHGTPFATACHRTTGSIAVLQDNSTVEMIADNGRGRRFVVHLPPMEHAVSITSWTPRTLGGDKAEMDPYSRNSDAAVAAEVEPADTSARQGSRAGRQLSAARRIAVPFLASPQSEPTESDSDTSHPHFSPAPSAKQRIEELAKLELAANRDRVLQEEFIVVGTATPHAKSLGNVVLEAHPEAPPLEDETPEASSEEVKECGRIILLRVSKQANGTCAASVFLECSQAGPVHALGTVGFLHESVLLASMGPRLLGLQFGEAPGPLLENCINKRLDREHCAITSSPGDTLGVAVADQEHGAGLWLLRPRIEVGYSFNLVACAQVRRPVTSCLPRLQLWHKAQQRCKERGLMMTADSAGLVATLGDPPWSKGERPWPLADHSGLCQLAAQPFPDRSAANLGSPLLKLQPGSLSPWYNDTDLIQGAGYLVSTSLGQVISIMDLADESVFQVLCSLEAIIADHPATTVVTAKEHKHLRCKAVTMGEETAIIVNGDMLAQFMQLPGSAQQEIADALEAETGAYHKPAALANMLREGLGL